MTESVAWKNRIIGYGSKPASQFLSNPNNFRTHPQQQRNAVRGSLNTLGWIDIAIENVTTGRLIDGHERIWQALQNGDCEVPFIQVSLSEAEEAQALLSLDPIAAMANHDVEQVGLLMQMVNTDNKDVMEFLSGLAQREGIVEVDKLERPNFQNLIDDMAGSHDSGKSTKDGNWIYVEFYGENDVYEKVLSSLSAYMKTPHELDRSLFLKMIALLEANGEAS